MTQLDDSPTSTDATRRRVTDRPVDQRDQVAVVVAITYAERDAIEAQFGRAAREAVDKATSYVKENPWQSLGIVAAVGVIVGMLLRRRD